MNYDNKEKRKKKGNLVSVENIRLFRSQSVIDEFFYGNTLYRELPMYWFVYERQAPVLPYELVIENYRKDEENKLHLYPESAIDELFTEKEMNAFKMYLQRVYKIECKIEEVDLPISFDTMGYIDIPLDSRTGWYQIHLENTYYLPFKVIGFFRTLSKWEGATTIWRIDGDN